MIKEVRNKGKRIYKSNFWKVVAVCFITAIMTGGSTIYLIRNEYNSNNSNLIHQSGILDNKSNSQIVRDFIKSAYKTKDKVDTYLNGTTKGIIATFVNNIHSSNSFVFGVLNAVNELVFKNKITSGIIIFIGVLVRFLYWLFGSNVIKVGKARFFLENRKYKKTRMKRLLFAYQDKKYKNIAKVMFKKCLYEFLWSFTIIGGIIKHYSYYFVPYIISENPDMKSDDVIRLSKNMTNGYRWKMFLLDLSFVPYYIFGICTFNTFNLLVTNPYKECSYTELYMNIRKNYITSKMLGYECLKEDLDGPQLDEEYPYDTKREKKKIEKIKYNIWELILLFFAFAFIGYLWEVILHLFSDGVFVNRVSLYGPWLPIYGCGGVLTLVLLNKYRDNPTLVFFASVILCGIVEYFSSLFMELAFNTRWWDYTGYFFNINGRVCLEGLLFFGFGCTASIYIVTPLLLDLFHKLDKNYVKFLTIILSILFLTDFVFYLTIGPNKGNGITSYDGYTDTINVKFDKLQ